MKLETIVKKCEKIKGWFTPAQQRELYPFVKGKKGILVEIGTYKGKSTLYWRLASKLQIVTIDIVNDPAPPMWVKDYEWKAMIDPKVLALGRIEYIIADNRDVAKRWDKQIDFLFIDGDERYDSIYGDMEAWWPFLKRGKYMFVHNYCTGNVQTKQAVDDWELKHKNEISFTYLIAEVWVVRKI
jgi:predicted O-methyltransferase YrrM